MAPHPRLPSHLLEGPFTISEAFEAGLTHTALRSRAWRRIGRGLYVHASFPDDPALILPGCRRLLPPDAVFSGRTAAALHGLELPYRDPIEVTVPLGSSASRSQYFNISRASLEPDEIVSVAGVPITVAARALAELTAKLGLVETVVHLDSALHAGIVSDAALQAMALRRSGRPGAGGFRNAVALSNGKAESPPESRVRVHLVTSGLPEPEVQTDLSDRLGNFLARADLYYRDAWLVIEYDGENHRDRLEEDNRRQNRLIAAGYNILRLTAADLRAGRAAVAHQVRTARAAALKRAA